MLTPIWGENKALVWLDYDLPIVAQVFYSKLLKAAEKLKASPGQRAET